MEETKKISFTDVTKNASSRHDLSQPILTEDNAPQLVQSRKSLNIMTNRRLRKRSRRKSKIRINNLCKELKVPKKSLMNAHELIRIFELSPIQDIKALIRTNQLTRAKSKNKFKKQRRVLRNTRRSEMTADINLEQGVKRLNASESSKTRLSNKNRSESQTTDQKLSIVRQRVQTAKRRVSRQTQQTQLKMSQRYRNRPLTAKQNVSMNKTNGSLNDREVKLETKKSLSIFSYQDWSYTGQWKGKKRHGQGTCNWNDGKIYQGEWRNDKMHGHGKLKLPNGTIYDGEFENNEATGKGKKIFPDSSVYKGCLKNGKMNGQGKLTMRNVSFEGTWKNDLPRGNTKKVGKNFSLSGNFNGYIQVNGSLCIKEFTKSPSKAYRYRGQLKQTHIDGKGEFKWPDGRLYFGEFFQGAMNGKGKLIWTDKYNGKATYKGNFLVNQFHGPGLLVWSNGDIYDGQFLNGTYHGYGEFAWADGIKKYKGEFEHGKMQGVGKFD
ncbi:unnamed protein product [Moneuplotes crassus]|uniref:Uncharacterized protein n=1 Tax=Euplotes crassus TaxID=5936 RepID=A0AAD1UA22_EUPCR|nr:unnamed protein product [Moneuplotes crassus]